MITKKTKVVLLQILTNVDRLETAVTSALAVSIHKVLTPVVVGLAFKVTGLTVKVSLFTSRESGRESLSTLMTWKRFLAFFDLNLTSRLGLSFFLVFPILYKIGLYKILTVD